MARAGRIPRWATPACVVVGAAAVCAIVLAADPTTPGGVLPVCPVKHLTGLNCPGCGTSRMLYGLLHGRLAEALHYNALALLAVPLLLGLFVAWILVRAGVARPPRWHRWRYVPAVVGAIVLVWAVVRNLPFAPFTALRV